MFEKGDILKLRTRGRCSAMLKMGRYTHDDEWVSIYDTETVTVINPLAANVKAIYVLTAAAQVVRVNAINFVKL